MPATSIEINDAFQRIAGALREAKLDWLLEQVLEQIRLGKAATTRVKELREQRFDSGRSISRKVEEMFTPGRTLDYPTTIDYSPQERISILLTAVEQLLVRVPEMQDSVASHFPGAQFVTDDESLVVSARSEIQTASTAKFKDIIDAIRREVGINGHQ